MEFQHSMGVRRNPCGRVKYCIDSLVESSFVLDRFDSPVESRFVNMVQYIVKSSEVQWNPVESTGVHVDCVGGGKVLVDCSCSNCLFLSFPIISVTTHSRKSNGLDLPFGSFFTGFYSFSTKPVCLGINGLLVLMLEYMSGVPLLSHLWHFLSSFMAKPAKPGFDILSHNIQSQGYSYVSREKYLLF